jgi:hypothetical protein
VDLVVETFDFSGKFLRELSRLDPNTQKAAKQSLALLQANPKAATLRCKPRPNFGRPLLWKIDVYSNKSYQISFEMVGRVACLKRIATHAEIDRNPRG